MTKHLVIPDCQIRPGDDLLFLEAIGNYIVEKKPDTIINIGDFADMPSLSSYDFGKRQFEGRRYVKDVDSVNTAQDVLLGPLERAKRAAKMSKHKIYNPKLVLTLGNHEHRISRAIDNDPKLEGVLDQAHLGYAEHGWEVHPFLSVVILDGVAYSHYFTTGQAGRPASTANAQLNKQHMSCIAGHQQGIQIANAKRADGKRITSIIAGSCYEHNEDYLGHQGNQHWRGVIMLHEVDEGEFDIMQVSLNHLKKNYL